MEDSVEESKTVLLDSAEAVNNALTISHEIRENSSLHFIFKPNFQCLHLKLFERTTFDVTCTQPKDLANEDKLNTMITKITVSYIAPRLTSIEMSGCTCFKAVYPQFIKLIPMWTSLEALDLSFCGNSAQVIKEVVESAAVLHNLTLVNLIEEYSGDRELTELKQIESKIVNILRNNKTLLTLKLMK